VSASAEGQEKSVTSTAPARSDGYDIAPATVDVIIRGRPDGTRETVAWRWG
jgi:hypothetical protein